MAKTVFRIDKEYKTTTTIEYISFTLLFSHVTYGCCHHAVHFASDNVVAVVIVVLDQSIDSHD